jgi:hypothetical protein
MDRNNLPGLTPLWLMSLALMLGVLLTTAIPALISAETVHAADWIGFAGSALIAIVAAIAIHYAWRGIVMQNRITLMSREESRIEAELPGLVEAQETIGKVMSEVALSTQRPEGVVNFLQGNNIGKNGIDVTAVTADIQAMLPRTDARTTRAATELFFRLNINAIVAADAQKRSETAKRDLQRINDIDPRFHSEVRATADTTRDDFEKRNAEMIASYTALQEFYKEIGHQIAEMRYLAPKYRAEIRAYIKI